MNLMQRNLFEHNLSITSGAGCKIDSRCFWKSLPMIFKQFMRNCSFTECLKVVNYFKKILYLLFGFLKHKIFGLSEGNANKSTAMVTPTQASVTYLYVLNKHLLTTYKGHTFQRK